MDFLLSLVFLAKSGFLEVIHVLNRQCPFPLPFSVPSSSAEVGNLELYFLDFLAVGLLTVDYIQPVACTCMRLEVRTEAEITFLLIWL